MTCLYCNAPVKYADCRIVVIRGFKSVACADLDACNDRVAAAERLRSGCGSGENSRMPDDENIPQIIWHQSGVNKSGEPFVQLLLCERIIGQMSPEEARDHARAITEAAEAAEQDAFIFDWVCNKVGSGVEQAAGLLQDFRAYRLARTGKRGGPSNPRDWVMPDKPQA